MLRLIRHGFCRVKDQVSTLLESFNKDVTSGVPSITTYHKFHPKIQSLSQDRQQSIYCQVAFQYPELAQIILTQAQKQGSPFKKVEFAIKSYLIKTNPLENLGLYEQCTQIAEEIQEEGKYHHRLSTLELIMSEVYDSMEPTLENLQKKLDHSAKSITYGTLDIKELLSTQNQLEDSELISVRKRLQTNFQLATNTIQSAFYLGNSQIPHQIISQLGEVMDLCAEKDIQPFAIPFCFTYTSSVTTYMFDRDNLREEDPSDLINEIKATAFFALGDIEEYGEVLGEAAACYLTMSILCNLRESNRGIKQNARKTIEEVIEKLSQNPSVIKQEQLRVILEELVQNCIETKEDGTQDLFKE